MSAYAQAVARYLTAEKIIDIDPATVTGMSSWHEPGYVEWSPTYGTGDAVDPIWNLVLERDGMSSVYVDCTTLDLPALIAGAVNNMKTP